MWDSLLAIKPLDNELIYPRAILHYAKGMAFLGKNNMAKAEEEFARLRELAKDSTLRKLTIWDINSMSDIVQIAVHVLAAEIYRNKKEFPKAFDEYNKAVALEDNLNYNEPPDWFFSVRHQLGRALIQAGNYEEAEKVYLQDLKTWKENGWALIGLYEALSKQGKGAAAQRVKNRFDKAWQYADFDISPVVGMR